MIIRWTSFQSENINLRPLSCNPASKLNGTENYEGREADVQMSSYRWPWRVATASAAAAAVAAPERAAASASAAAAAAAPRAHARPRASLASWGSSSYCLSIPTLHSDTLNLWTVYPVLSLRLLKCKLRFAITTSNITLTN